MIVGSGAPHAASFRARGGCGRRALRGRQSRSGYGTTRPSAALVERKPSHQHTEIHYDANTQSVTLKMLVQDPLGYFIPNLRRDNFAVCENGQRQRNASVEIERSSVGVAALLEYGGRYRGVTTALTRELAPAVNQFLDELGPGDHVLSFVTVIGLKSSPTLSLRTTLCPHHL